MADSTRDTGHSRAPVIGPEGRSDSAPDAAPAAKPARQTASLSVSTAGGGPGNSTDNSTDNIPGNASGDASDNAPQVAVQNAAGTLPGNTPDTSPGRAAASPPEDAPRNDSAKLRASAADNTAPDSAFNASDDGPDVAPGRLSGKATELALFLAASPDVIQVQLTRVQGSSPRGEGTTMCVSATGLCGTIGGGQLEYMAIDQARALLAHSGARTEMDVPLGPEIGQCCGGRVTVLLHRMEDADRADLLRSEREARQSEPHVYLYGAGHVGRALARAFAPLPLRLLLVDSRETELLLCSAGVETCLTPLPESVLRAAPAGAAHIIATHDHALDFLLTSEALARSDAAYVGLIGSKTKRAQFLRWHAEQIPDVPTAALVCPIGGHAVPDKRPEVIAALVVAEVLQALAIWARVTAEV
jgi:xanthine dehydrogenase accessory factor